jgi:hypothetical protein
VGCLPSTVILSLEGAQICQGNYLVSIALALGFLAITAVMIIYRKQLYDWLNSWH